MISVIVPVYKTEKYLKKCVESIQSQTYGELEIILVDDGSPDNSGKLCDELAKEDGRIRVIHRENGGLAAARNSGLTYAINGGLADKHHYVAFVDSDDTIDKNMYSVMFELAEKHHADLVLCGHQSVKTERDAAACAPEGRNVQALNNEQLWDEVFGRLNNSACNKLYRAELCAELLFPQGIIHGEDLLFNLKYIKNCKTAIQVDNEFYHYYCREGSITKSGFNANKLLEITSKDLARDVVISECPRLRETADVFCFRARMNVMRSICAGKKEKEYSTKVRTYLQYTRENYRAVSRRLRFKERVEYILLQYAYPIYKFMTRRM